MSRIAKKPLKIIEGVDVNINFNIVNIIGKKGKLEFKLNNCIDMIIKDSIIYLSYKKEYSMNDSILGTTRIILENIMIGVTNGFKRKLLLIGIGYRARIEKDILILNLGFSHSVNFIIPKGITITVVNNNEILIVGISKEEVGQIAAEIRSFRPPELYKGKGIRYSDEKIVLKETKKK